MKTKNNVKVLLFAAALIIVALLVYFLVFGNKGSQKIEPLPDYALKSPEIKEAYLFAQENSEALTGVNCYCGCMQNAPAPDNNRVHVRGIIDCFMELNGSFEEHGSGCSTCVSEALRVKSLVAEGKTKDEIRAAIDSEYGHPQSGGGCGIVPNTTAGIAAFVSPTAGGGGCAAPNATAGLGSM